jgi:enoyl-CoA hydratase/carnithine racemase
MIERPAAAPAAGKLCAGEDAAVTGEPEVQFETRGAVGLITLNRPKALNALTHRMVVEMKAQLDAWAVDPNIASVIVRGAGERAFCAGGDIRALYESGRAGTPYALHFWHDEYVLNSSIKHYPKPYVALIHGVCMGGGIGVSVHGRHRVADATAVFAMPETGIGFFPDVGGSHFLPRCPGEIGMYMALAGTRLKVADSLYAGLATHFLPAEEWSQLIDALASGDTAADVISEMTEWPVPDAPLSQHRARIDRIFASSSVEDVLESLDKDGCEWSRLTAATIRSRSPTSLKIAYSEIRAGLTLTFADCMKMEYRISNRMLSGHDFYEGVRATIIDKDNAPRWQPADLDEITDGSVEAYFAPLDGKELEL